MERPSERRKLMLQDVPATTCEKKKEEKMTKKKMGELLKGRHDSIATKKGSVTQD